MKIYTGYFAKTKAYEEKGLLPISIARYTPSFFKGKSLPELAPTSYMLSKYKEGQMTEAEYDAFYVEILSKRNVLVLIERIAEEKDVILCCYEKNGDFCHRHILANYLNKKYKLDVKELIL